jgi:hypothetical protein
VYRNLGTPPGAGPEFVAFLEGRNGNSTNSGAQALTLLSLLERPAPRPEDRPDLAALLVRPDDDAVRAGLVRTLMAMVDAEGRVWERWTEAKKGGLVVKEPVYYPGELMLALVRDYEGRRDEAVLQTVERVGRAQIRLAQTPGAVPDHWVMQALDRLDALQPENPEWREAAYAMARDYMDEQFPPQLPPFPDYRGSYRRDLEVPRTTRAASRGEALGGVVRIAWRHGDPAGDLERSLVEGARHLTEQMWTPENSWFLPRPKEAEGAIRMGAIDMHCRIDNNQHGVVAMSNALAVLRRSK